MISRRKFLASSAALAIAPALPTITAAAPVASVEAVKPATTIWVGGHHGEFDWHPFNAPTWRDAVKQMLEYHGYGNDEEIADTMTLTDEELRKELKYAGMDAERAHKMDGLRPDEIRGHHWIRTGLGSTCDRCGSECYDGDGGRAIGTEVVCEDCLTLTDLLHGDKWDIERAEEQIIEVMVDADCDEGEAFEVLSRGNDMSVITPTIWVKCLAEARAAL
ncbi:hypothetical protein ACVITL_002868 [Rhizobium pisi]